MGNHVIVNRAPYTVVVSLSENEVTGVGFSAGTVDVDIGRSKECQRFILDPGQTTPEFQCESNVLITIQKKNKDDYFEEAKLLNVRINFDKLIRTL